MAPTLFAQDGDFLTFCHRWGDAASILGFALSLLSVLVALVGFFLTLRGQRRIREATEQALSQAAYKIAVAEVGTLLRQLEGMRDAVRHQLWLPAVFRGGEARYLVLSLSANSTLTANEQRDLSRGDERCALRYNTSSSACCPTAMARAPLPHGTGEPSMNWFGSAGRFAGDFSTLKPEVRMRDDIEFWRRLLTILLTATEQGRLEWWDTPDEPRYASFYSDGMVHLVLPAEGAWPPEVIVFGQWHEPLATFRPEQAEDLALVERLFRLVERTCRRDDDIAFKTNEGALISLGPVFRAIEAELANSGKTAVGAKACG